MVDKLHNFRPMLLIIVIPILFSCATTQQKQVESKDAQFYNNRGIGNAAKGQYDQAVSDFTMALEINPRDALAYYHRARACYFKKEYDKSWRDIRKAQDLGYKVPLKFLDDFRKASGRQNTSLQTH
jgi:tetratricopeptide (TPR) repeat protein